MKLLFLKVNLSICFRKKLEPTTVKEHQEYHTFIIFSNVNDKTRNDILTYLSKVHMFLPLKLVSHNTVTHCSGLFTEAWFKNFYGNSYYHIFDASRNQQSMADHKGSGTFTWLIIKDLHPVYNEIPGKGYVNQNIYNLKSSLRHWVVTNFLSTHHKILLKVARISLSSYMKACCPGLSKLI